MAESRWEDLPAFMRVLAAYRKDLEKGGPMIEANPDQANLISSYAGTFEGQTYHIPVLDIDMELWTTESTTPGHHHLAINKLLTQEQYDKLLNVLVEVGIVQQGIIDMQWKEDGQTAVRIPGNVKTKKSLSSGKQHKESMSVSHIVNTPGEALDNFVAVPLGELQSDVVSNPDTLLTKVEAPKKPVATLSDLAKVATQTGQSLTDVVDAYVKLKEKLEDKNLDW